MFKLALALSIALSSSAFASSASYKSQYYVRFHFSEKAYGKTVKSVFVHTGVSVDTSSPYYETPNPVWQDVNDVQLHKTGDHFFVRTQLKASYFISSGGIRKVAPVAQYWVTFEDGSKLVTDVYDIPVKTSHRFSDRCMGTQNGYECIDPEIVGNVSKSYDSDEDATHTFADEIQYYRVN